jgi:uridine kinase
LTGKIIAICGGTCSGKSTFAHQAPGAVVLSTDNYYYDVTKQVLQADGTINFEDPASAELQACVQACQKLAAGEAVDVPLYDKASLLRTGYQRVEPPANGLVVIEGNFAFEQPIKAVAKPLIFLDISIETRKSRRLKRDVEVGIPLEVIMQRLDDVDQYEKKHLDRLRSLADTILTEQEIESYWTAVK